MLRAGQLALKFAADIDALAGGADDRAAVIADAIEASQSSFATQAAALVRELPSLKCEAIRAEVFRTTERTVFRVLYGFATARLGGQLVHVEGKLTGAFGSR